MIRNRRQLATDEVDDVVDTIAATAAELRVEGRKVAEQRNRMDVIAARLERLAEQLRQGGSNGR